MKTILPAACIAASLMCGGCMTQRGYDGPKRPADEVAHIGGDLRLTAGVPMSVLLRKVDDYTLGVSESGIDVIPGKHTLLVDCLIRETASTTRYSIEVEVGAGQHYKLVAEVGPGLRECTSVSLQLKN